MNTATEPKTGIIFRPDTYDLNIVKETKYYLKPPVELKPDDRVLDIGGHIGSFAARVKLACPSADVVSIEPEQSNFEVMQQNAAKFGFEPIRGAVVDDSQHEQTVQLFVNKHQNNALHTVIKTRGRDVQEVMGIGLGFLLENFAPTVIKCDIEYGELGLPWAKLSQCPSVRLIMMELHLMRGHDAPKALVETISGQGFKLVKEPKFEKNWTTYAYWAK